VIDGTSGDLGAWSEDGSPTVSSGRAYEFEVSELEFTQIPYVEDSHVSTEFSSSPTGTIYPTKLDTIKYYIGFGVRYYTFDDFTYYMGGDECDDIGFNYTLTWSEDDDGNIPDFIRLDGYNNIIAVNTSDDGDIGTYRMTLTARPTFGPSETTTVVVDVDENTPPGFFAKEFED
jgi:hypothetical protein